MGTKCRALLACGSVPRPSRQVQSRTHLDQVGEGVRLHLSHHLASVCLDGDLTDPELAGDLLVQQSGDDQGHDLALAVAELGVAVAESLQLCLPAERSPTPLDCTVD